MSLENVEVVRRLHEAWLRGDNEGALAYFDSEAVTDMTARPDGGLYYGPEGMYEAMRIWLETWDEYSFVPEHYLDAGDDKVVLLWRESGRGKESEVEVEIVGATVWTVRWGRVIRAKPYTDRAAALDAVGLHEGESLAGESSG